MNSDFTKPFYEDMRACLLDGTEKLLRRKAALGENVVYSNNDGTLIEMPAAKALQLFLENRQSQR